MRSDPFDMLRAHREKFLNLTSPLRQRPPRPPRPARRERLGMPASVSAKSAPACYPLVDLSVDPADKENKKENKPVLGFYTGLSFRFDHAESQFLKPGESKSITTPARVVKAEGLHVYPTGTCAFLEYRETKVSTPLSYLSLSKQTPVTYIRESSHRYIVTQEDLRRSRLKREPRKPSNQTLFKESALDYAKRKQLLFKKNTSFELCHNLAHRFMGNKAQERDNIFVQTAHFNSQQLAVENVISKLADLLGKIEVRQTCERFDGGNIGKLVRYELILPGCLDTWEVSIRAEHAQVSPHVKSAEIHLNLIVEKLIKSDLPEVRAHAENLKRELEFQHQKKKKKMGQEKKSFAFYGASLEDPVEDLVADKSVENVDFNL